MKRSKNRNPCRSMLIYVHLRGMTYLFTCWQREHQSKWCWGHKQRKWKWYHENSELHCQRLQGKKQWKWLRSSNSLHSDWRAAKSPTAERKSKLISTRKRTSSVMELEQFRTEFSLTVWPLGFSGQRLISCGFQPLVINWFLLASPIVSL